MSAIAEIQPKERQLVIDLVRAAGVDVSEWANFKGGAKNAASNPKFCYEWSFVEPQKTVVLNLWHKSISQDEGVVFQRLNMREFAARLARLRDDLFRRKEGKVVWEKRAIRMDVAIQTAVRERLAVRVIVCEGDMREIDVPDAEASHVHKRLLDPVPWAVTEYNWETGDCVVTRGALPDRFADQFAIAEAPTQVERRDVSGEVFFRSAEVRRRVLHRAGGRCEWCGEAGFVVDDGRIFLETHHVVPLAEGGPDTEANVVALCPNHHREAHLGRTRKKIQEELLKRLASGVEALRAIDSRLQLGT